MASDERVYSQQAEDLALPAQEFAAARGECRCRELRLVAERSHRLYFIAAGDIDYIEAYGNYVRIHVGDCEFVRRDTLARLSRDLGGAGFQVVRRSTLLNLRRVAFAERLENGALAFTLASGARLISRTRFRLREWP